MGHLEGSVWSKKTAAREVRHGMISTLLKALHPIILNQQFSTLAAHWNHLKEHLKFLVPEPRSTQLLHNEGWGLAIGNF